MQISELTHINSSSGLMSYKIISESTKVDLIIFCKHHSLKTKIY